MVFSLESLTRTHNHNNNHGLLALGLERPDQRTAQFFSFAHLRDSQHGYFAKERLYKKLFGKGA